MQYYRITNTAEEPCHMTWNKALLSEQDLLAYEDYKLTADYIGIDPEDQAQKKKIVEAVKMRPFFARLGRDVMMPTTDRIQRAKDVVVTEVRYEWRFCIGPNIEKLLAESSIDPEALSDESQKIGLRSRLARRLAKARDICAKYQIPYLHTDNIQQLADKIQKMFGPNVRILTEAQWITSGLSSRKIKKIYIAPKNSMMSTMEIEEGYLAEELISEIEAQQALGLFPAQTFRPIAEHLVRLPESAPAVGVSTATSVFTPIGASVENADIKELKADNEKLKTQVAQLLEALQANKPQVEVDKDVPVDDIKMNYDWVKESKKSSLGKSKKLGKL